MHEDEDDDNDGVAMFGVDRVGADDAEENGDIGRLACELKCCLD